MNLLWNKGAMDLEEISRSLQIEPKVALEALSELEKECVIGKRVEKEREVYYPAIGRERCIELCKMVLKDSSKSLLQLEMEAEEETRKEFKKFLRKAHLGI